VMCWPFGRTRAQRRVQPEEDAGGMDGNGQSKNKDGENTNTPSLAVAAVY
jgi:hypothetical protein